MTGEAGEGLGSLSKGQKGTQRGCGVQGAACKDWKNLQADAGGNRLRAVPELRGRPAWVAALGIKVCGPRIKNLLMPGGPVPADCCSLLISLHPRRQADGRGL